MYDNEELYNRLKELQVMPSAQLDKAFSLSQSQQKPLGDILLEENLISETDLGKLLADMLSLPYVSLTEVAIPKEVLLLIPESIAKENRIIAFKKDDKGLHVALEKPLDEQRIASLQSSIGLPLIVYLTTKRDIAKTLSLYLKDISEAFEAIMNEATQQSIRKKSESIEPPIIKIVDTLLAYAYEYNASDVHLEIGRKTSLVRFRIDGVLHDIIRFPLDMYSQIVTRIKVMANLRTDERHVPQDGKISFTIDSEALDIRVSTVPVNRGEKIVMRLLSQRAREITLQSLGFSARDLEKVTNAYSKPYGTILATGPTGSGKTTTMYAILKLLNKRDVNIMTIEDPIEYEIDSVNQIQVNTKANLTFATGLRSILRQDPNTILVGEIRDSETSGIAITAAMTGHLVLSTLHTNDAATSIPRLFDMGIEPFLIASTVNVIIAQRLLRRIHSVCRVSEEIDISEIKKLFAKNLVEAIFGTKKSTRVYKGKGCKICHNTGYEGRTGVYEVMEINDTIKEAIASKADATVIQKLAERNGMKTMLEDGLEKVKNGDTTIEEVIRVTRV